MKLFLAFVTNIMCLLSGLEYLQACQTPKPVSLVLSGGSALGSYQAGVTYYITEALKSEPSRYEIKALAGGSAGAINAALSVSVVCGKNAAKLSEKPLYKFWTNVNLTNFSDPSFIEAITKQVKANWSENLKPGCDLVLSIPVSKLNPEKITYSNGLTLTKPSESFTFRITDKKIYNYINPSSSSRPIVADLKSNFSHDFDELQKIVVASMSFPFLFAPQKINYCRVQPNKPEWMHSNWPFQCKKTKTDHFLDGVIFLKEPIDDIIELTNSALTKNCGSNKNQWLTIPPTLQQTQNTQPEALFINISTKQREYEGKNEKLKSTSVENSLQIFNNYYYANKDVELIKLLEHQPSMQERLFITKNYFPRVSEHMFDFFGFSSSKLLQFDFLLGMLEGQIFYEKHFADLEYLKYRSSLIKDTKIKAQFECLQAGLLKAKTEQCKSQDKNFLRLAQLTTDLIYNECKSYKGKLKKAPEFRLCRKAQQGKVPIKWSNFKGNWKKKSSETYFQFKMRRLQELSFEFDELGLNAEQTQQAPLEIKKQVQQRVDALQESNNVNKISSLVLDSLEYYPDQNYGYVLVGNVLEFGYKTNKLLAFKKSDPYWSSTLSLQIQNWSEWLEFKNQQSKAYTFLYGVEKQLNTSTSVMQSAVGLRLGYQLSDEKLSKFSGCKSLASSSAQCQGLVMQTMLRLTYLDTFNLQFAIERKLFKTPSGVSDYQFQLGMGLKF